MSKYVVTDPLKMFKDKFSTEKLLILLEYHKKTLQMKISVSAKIKKGGGIKTFINFY